MYKDSKRTCIAIVLLIKPFVWRRSRCRRCRGLLKLPDEQAKATAKNEHLLYLARKYYTKSQTSLIHRRQQVRK